jgi:hypothetical protein
LPAKHNVKSGFSAKAGSQNDAQREAGNITSHNKARDVGADRDISLEVMEVWKLMEKWSQQTVNWCG